MRLLKMALIAGLLALASCTDGELVAPESIQAAIGASRANQVAETVVVAVTLSLTSVQI